MALPKLLKQVHEDILRVEAKIDAMMSEAQKDRVEIPESTMSGKLYDVRLHNQEPGTTPVPEVELPKGNIPGLPSGLPQAPATSELLAKAAGIRDFDVEDYDSMTVGEILKAAKDMSPAQRSALLTHEKAKASPRTTLVGTLENWKG